ncbi:MAG: 3-hydroxyacyl-ACP dehydratase [Desulfamplus sp.]|nr:3-hydroxyacyl-ACP dehydratase [Desulfamplus sp.]MBF0390786.1 3-hydroxyacyl-ACP dehydratase [Desulfamplus sp.]
MNYAGIDIGSRTIEVVVVNSSGDIICSLQADTGFDPIAESLKLFDSIENSGIKYQRIMATGYGRTLFEVAYTNLDPHPLSAPKDLTLADKCSTVTEIKAHARGVAAYFPNAATILDIGGQDSKAIALNNNGKVKKFEMNDRCAAGTGKFLEIMARTLGFSIDDFGKEALLAQNDLTINSMCTVFAESEVTSLIAKGADRREIAKGLHISVMKRAAGMINRVRSDQSDSIVFTGGVAKNGCMVTLISEKLGCSVLVPDNPQMIGAFGAALISSEMG